MRYLWVVLIASLINASTYEDALEQVKPHIPTDATFAEIVKTKISSPTEIGARFFFTRETWEHPVGVPREQSHLDISAPKTIFSSRSCGNQTVVCPSTCTLVLTRHVYGAGYGGFKAYFDTTDQKTVFADVAFTFPGKELSELISLPKWKEDFPDFCVQVLHFTHTQNGYFTLDNNCFETYATDTPPVGKHQQHTVQHPFIHHDHLHEIMRYDPKAELPFKRSHTPVIFGIQDKMPTFGVGLKRLETLYLCYANTDKDTPPHQLDLKLIPFPNLTTVHVWGFNPRTPENSVVLTHTLPKLRCINIHGCTFLGNYDARLHIRSQNPAVWVTPQGNIAFATGFWETLGAWWRQDLRLIDFICR